jgi:hypothetical protein
VSETCEHANSNSYFFSDADNDRVKNLEFKVRVLERQICEKNDEIDDLITKILKTIG